jgi:hypothetical protein
MVLQMKKSPAIYMAGRWFSATGHSDLRITDMQDLHAVGAVGAVNGVVAVALGQDHPVAFFHDAALAQFVDGFCSAANGFPDDCAIPRADPRH